MNIHALILAAGESKRLGQPKQLLKYQGTTLLERVISQLETLLSDVHVVLGANESDIQQNIKILNPISNPDWQKGLGSSLACGIKNIPDCDAVLVALCDQILIPVSHYQELIALFETYPNHIIATEHKSIGVPAIFPAHFFNELNSLAADQGAKAIINQHQEQVKTVKSLQAAIDIDSPEDLPLLNSHSMD